MARTEFRDGRGSRHGANARRVASALCLLLISSMAWGCSLDSPASPNSPNQLTGQNPSQDFNFQGTIRLTKTSNSIFADDTTTVTITATVRDGDNDPIPNGALVTFRTDLGVFLLDVDGDGSVDETVTAVQLGTLNGQASVTFRSSDGRDGTATITASIGDATTSTQVVIERDPINGRLAMAFGTSGDGEVVATGIATEGAPLDVTVGVTAFDDEDNPLVGATVKFLIEQDTTDEGTGVEAAHWITGSETVTGPEGTAVNVLRVFGPGDIVLQAALFDPISGDFLALSNRIILTTRTALVAGLAFGNGEATITGNSPFNIVATVTDTSGNGQSSLTVRFRISNDGSTGGASLTTALGLTDENGQISTQLEVSGDPGDVVSVVAEVIDSNGSVRTTSNEVTATLQ